LQLCRSFKIYKETLIEISCWIEFSTDSNVTRNFNEHNQSEIIENAEVLQWAE